MTQIQSYSAYQRIADRIFAVQNQYSKARSAFDALDKDHKNVKECDVNVELTNIENAMLESIILNSEMLALVREEKRKVAL